MTDFQHLFTVTFVYRREKVGIRGLPFHVVLKYWQLNRCDTCDRETDRQNYNFQYHSSIAASCGKNWPTIAKVYLKNYKSCFFQTVYVDIYL